MTANPIGSRQWNLKGIRDSRDSNHESYFSPSSSGFSHCLEPVCHLTPPGAAMSDDHPCQAVSIVRLLSGLRSLNSDRRPACFMNRNKTNSAIHINSRISSCSSLSVPRILCELDGDPRPGDHLFIELSVLPVSNWDFESAVSKPDQREIPWHCRFERSSDDNSALGFNLPRIRVRAGSLVVSVLGTVGFIHHCCCNGLSDDPGHLFLSSGKCGI